MIKSLQLKLMLVVFAFVVLSAALWVVRLDVVQTGLIETRLNEQITTLAHKQVAYIQAEIKNKKIRLQSTWSLIGEGVKDQVAATKAAAKLADSLSDVFSTVSFHRATAAKAINNNAIYLNDKGQWVSALVLPVTTINGNVLGQLIAEINVVNLLNDFNLQAVHTKGIQSFISLGGTHSIEFAGQIVVQQDGVNRIAQFFTKNLAMLYSYEVNTVVNIETLDQTIHLLLLDIPHANARIGFFYTDESLNTKVNEALPKFYLNLFLLGLFVIMASFLGLRVIVIHRLTVLSKATEKVNRDLGLMSVPYLGEDEIGRLGKSINIMLAHIQNLMLGLDKKIIEINDKKKETEKLAYYDALTGLANRVLFKDKLDEILLDTTGGEAKFALLYLDLDGFKRINDSYGHESGDELLIEVSKRLTQALRNDDVIARIGGDEFAILLSKIDSPHYAIVVANKIIEELNQPIKIHGKEDVVGVSIGITIAPDDGVDAALLMKNADLSMYSAKARGRNTFDFYTQNLNLEVKHRLTLERDLRVALRDGQFELYYQPLVDLQLGNIVAAEALIRWNHPTRGLIMPEEFVSVAEDTGLIVAIGKWVLNTACHQVNSIHRALNSDFKLSVNISAKQLNDEAFLDNLQKVLQTSRLKPEGLELEITETAMMDGASSSFDLLYKIREIGCSLAIDDFGTGYSSLSYLKRLPINSLKVDKSFVENLPSNVEDKAITSLITTMASNLNYKIIAEGIETQEQYDFLKDCGCHYGQGFLFSKPVSTDKFMTLLFDDYNANRDGFAKD